MHSAAHTDEIGHCMQHLQHGRCEVDAPADVEGAIVVKQVGLPVG